jgi:hypothetical protein
VPVSICFKEKLALFLFGSCPLCSSLAQQGQGQVHIDFRIPAAEPALECGAALPPLDFVPVTVEQRGLFEDPLPVLGALPAVFLAFLVSAGGVDCLVYTLCPLVPAAAVAFIAVIAHVHRRSPLDPNSRSQ